MKIKSVLLRIFGVLAFLLFALFLAVYFGGDVPDQERFEKSGLPKGVKALDQNWDDDVRQQMLYTSFGSRLMPYSWFLHLELPEGQIKLRDDEVLENLGFILQDAVSNNPEGLPAGFARDSARANDDQDWVGLTCAACHMGQINYQEHKFFIDGGPGIFDFTGFEKLVYASLKAAYENEEKFQRFSSSLGNQSQDQVDALKEQLKERVDFFTHRLRANATEVPYGYGRIDAFGQIFNAVTSTALGLPNNYHAPDGPVSIPVLWDAPHLDVVQWNASAPNQNPGPLAQNATTALAVYGQIDMLSGGLGYSSTTRIGNLAYIQNQFYKLTSPQWPEEVLGSFDQALVQQGSKIYEQNCLSCHTLVDRSDAKRELVATVVPMEEVGTDPKAATNFTESMSKTGPLEGKKLGFIAGPKFGETARTLDLVVNAMAGSLLNQPINTLKAIIVENHKVPKAENLDTTANVYKARPLSGIWAASPYLHNGSVPTLKDMLKIPELRPQTFYVGSREFDPIDVGLYSGEGENSSLFDTSLGGNSNGGHLYGTHLSEEDKKALLEYLKTL